MKVQGSLLWGVVSRCLPDDCTGPAQPVYYVSVNTQASYKTLIPWPGLPATFTLNGQAKMRLGEQ